MQQSYSPMNALYSQFFFRGLDLYRNPRKKAVGRLKLPLIEPQVIGTSTWQFLGLDTGSSKSMEFTAALSRPMFALEELPQ